jgi:hypothetical protein
MRTTKMLVWILKLLRQTTHLRWSQSVPIHSKDIGKIPEPHLIGLKWLGWLQAIPFRWFQIAASPGFGLKNLQTGTGILPRVTSDKGWVTTNHEITLEIIPWDLLSLILFVRLVWYEFVPDLGVLHTTYPQKWCWLLCFGIANISKASKECSNELWEQRIDIRITFEWVGRQQRLTWMCPVQ